MSYPPGELGLMVKLVELGALAALSGFGMWLLFRVVNKLGLPFIEAQKQIAESMSGMAESVRDTKQVVCDMVNGDRSDHREIILTLQVLAEEVKTLRKEIRND